MNLSATHAISVSPTTGETLSSVPWASEQQVDAAIALAEQGYRQWRNVSVAERAATLRNVGSAMRARGEALAQMISREMGKPIAQCAAKWLNPPIFVTGMLNTARRCSIPRRRWLKTIKR